MYATVVVGVVLKSLSNHGHHQSMLSINKERF
jgi:hypothetical protein